MAAVLLHTLAGSSILASDPIQAAIRMGGGAHLGPIGSDFTGNWEATNAVLSTIPGVPPTPLAALPHLVTVLLLLWMCLRPTRTTQQPRHSFAVTAPQSEMWHGAAGHGLTHGVCILLSPSAPLLLPTHPFLLHISSGKKKLVFVITWFQLLVFRLHLICWHHFEYCSLRNLQSSLLGTMHIFIFPLCELCSKALPRKFHWGWTAVTGLEHKCTRQMRDCIKSLIWGAFIPSPLTTLLLSQNEIRLTWHNLFPVNSHSTHDSVI